ncbi:mitochondrial calcium uniporter regulator 1 isoform 1-T1 [Aulostomus maculatus]
MVLTRCHTRLKVFALNRPGKWFEPAYKQGRASGEPLRVSSPTSGLTAVTNSAGFPFISAPTGNDSDMQPLRDRTTLGPKRTLPPSPRRMSVSEFSTVKTLQYDMKPVIPQTEGRELFFDTHMVVQLLEKNGFTTQQAEVMVKVLVRMTTSNMDAIYSDMVTKVQQEILLQRIMSQIAAVKKDMVILEKSEFSTLLMENEKLKIHLAQLNVRLADVMNKVRSDTIMDMNLEKSHVKELKAEHEKKLLETRTEIMEMTAEQELHLTQANMKIDTEVAGLKTMLESLKLDTIKYLAGSVFTCLTVMLGFYRVWM